jgi:hypothetical protein
MGNIGNARTMGHAEFPDSLLHPPQQLGGILIAVQLCRHTGGQRCKDSNTITGNIRNTRTMGRAEFPDSLLHPLQQLGGILIAVQLNFANALVANVAKITTQ